MYLPANIDQHTGKLLSLNYSPVVPSFVIKEDSQTRLDSRMNVLRCIAIMSIVWGHCLYNMEGTLFLSPGMRLIQIIMLQAGRMGTIMFFIISGYFLSDKLETFTCISYLRHRFHTIILPWFTFLSALVCLQVFCIISKSPIELSTVGKASYTIIQLYKGCIFHAAFWFVPVALFSSVVLIALKRIVKYVWLGLPLLAITLFYCINLYYAWISVNHTRAFAAYLVFMWVGIHIRKNSNLITEKLNHLKYSGIIISVIICFFLACWEGYLLKLACCADAFASIRFSNILLSVILFLLVIKSDRLHWLNYLKPQKTVFGVYLIHCLITTEILPYLNWLEKQFLNTFSIPVIIFTQACNFAVVIVLSFILVNCIRKFRIGEIIFPSHNRMQIKVA